MRTHKAGPAPRYVIERDWNWVMLPFLDAELDMLENEWMRCASNAAITRRIPREYWVRLREVTDATRMRLQTLADLCRVDIKANETPRNPPTPLWLLAGEIHRDRKRARALRASVDEGLKALELLIAGFTEDA